MDDIITLSYGSGGEKSEELIKEIIIPYLGNDKLNNLSDGAYLDLKGKLAFSTDSFVINPLFFKGGDIGKLAVCGTCNDLIMCGSIPRFLSLSLVIEEGLSTEVLKSVINSIKIASEKANVKIVTGDTKVVNKGSVDKIYINTSGIGEVTSNLDLGKHRLKKGDKVIITGNIGDHGISIICEREGFFNSSVSSDCDVLMDVSNIVFNYGKKVKILRDPTRGGLATTLNEFVDGTRYSIELNEDKLPFSKEAKGASDILGIDLLYSANEGKAVIIVSEDIADEIVNKLKNTKIGKDAAVIGKVVDYEREKVFLKGPLGNRKIIGKLVSDLFPRIC